MLGESGGPMSDIGAFLGPDVEDVWEETFLLFSQPIPSQNLGFMDQTSSLLKLTVGERDLEIQQSPTVLASNRGGGTTGAVVWKITPLVASWLSSTNFLFQNDFLGSRSSVLELGCGISGLIGLCVAPKIKSYVLTDQDYVMKLLKLNIVGNQPNELSSKGARKSSVRSKKSAASSVAPATHNIVTQSLDWETDEVTTALLDSDSEASFDVVIACDCIYNDALIPPLVQTCIDACRLRVSNSSNDRPTLCLVAQQLRSAEVFESWLTAFSQAFRVWRLPDELLSEGLKSNSGFVLHVGVLR